MDIGFAPPPEVWRNFNNQQQSEIAKLFLAPKAMHKIRLTNNSKYPITTAPALILKGGQVLGQGMTTYTSVGGGLDLPITTAVDILVKKSDKETGRDHNAVNWEGNAYAKINLARHDQADEPPSRAGQDRGHAQRAGQRHGGRPRRQGRDAERVRGRLGWDR